MCFDVDLFVDVVEVYFYQFIFGDVVGLVDGFDVLFDQEQCVVDNCVGQCDFQYDQGGGGFVLVQCGENGVDIYYVFWIFIVF